MNQWTTALSAAAFVALCTAPTSAQTRITSRSDFRTREVRDESLLEAGRVTVFVSATGGWAYGLSTPDGGNGRSQNTVFSLPSIGAGVMLTDAFQIRLSVNGVFIYAGIDGDSTRETTGIGGTVQGLYHLELAHGMAAYVGAGLGGYYSTRTVPTNAGLEARYTGGGFQGQVPFGLLIQPGASLFLRGGIRLDVLAGAESTSTPVGGSEGSTIVNVLVNAELSLGFRF